MRKTIKNLVDLAADYFVFVTIVNTVISVLLRLTD